MVVSSLVVLVLSLLISINAYVVVPPRIRQPARRNRRNQLVAATIIAIALVPHPTHAADVQQVLSPAISKAMSSSVSAAKSSVIQVTLLMWTRTAMNYQYRFGGSFQESLKALFAEGGVGRLYSGLPFALIQVPSSRFCDVLSNEVS